MLENKNSPDLCTTVGSSSLFVTQKGKRTTVSDVVVFPESICGRSERGLVRKKNKK